MLRAFSVWREDQHWHHEHLQISCHSFCRDRGRVCHFGNPLIGLAGEGPAIRSTPFERAEWTTPGLRDGT